MKYRYREPHEMKDSGVEWLGMIPKEWEVSRLKYHFNIKSGATPKSETKEYWDGDINWYTPVDLGEVKFLSESKRKITETGLKSCSASIIKAGSVIMSSRAPIGSVSIALTDFTTNQGCKSLESKGSVADNFIYYCILISKKNLENLGSGTTFLEISGTAFSNYQMPYLQIKEQIKIANFLDEKCSQFDSIIEKKEALIVRLEEAKKSLISEVVTGKVKVIEKANGEYEIIKRDTSEMKDSGVEWLGVIPKEWEVSRLKHFIKNLESGVSVNSFESESANENEIGVLKTSCVSNYIFNSEENKKVIEGELNRVSCPVKINNIIISRMNTPELVGASGYVDKDFSNLYLPDRLWQTVFFKENRYDVELISYILKSTRFKNEITSIATGTSSSMKNITKGDFLNLRIPNIPTIKQKNILNFIKIKIQKFDLTIEKQKQLIEKLKSAKQSLISEAVTGKIEVL